MNYDVLAGRYGGSKLYSRLDWLFTGAEDHDGPPTQGMREVAAELGEELAAQDAALDGLLSGELAELNGLAEERDVPYVVVPVIEQR